MLCQRSFNIEDWLAGACVFQPFFQPQTISKSLAKGRTKK